MGHMPSARRLDLHYMAMQAGFWAMFAAIVAYQTALLLERGFTNSEAGLMTAVRCLAGIVFQPLLGSFSDRHPNLPLKGIVTLSMVLSLAAGVWYWLCPAMGLWETALVWVVIGGLEVSSYPLMDAMAVQFINDGVPIRYSLGRGVGSFAYAVVCVLLGLQVGALGMESTLVTHLALVGIEILLVATYPPYRGTIRQGERGPKPQSALSLLKHNPRFTLMLAGVFLGLTAIMPLSNFLVNIVTSRGGTQAHLGVALFLMGGLKAVLLLLTWNWVGVLAVQPIQMLGYGLFTPASVYYVNESVPAADRVKGQTVMMVASNGLGGMMGGVLAGYTLDLGGANLMLGACILCGCAGALLCLASVLRGGKKVRPT